MISAHRELGNIHCLTPIKLDKNYREFEDDNCEELFKSHMSSPSTIDSPLFSPKKSLSEISDLQDDLGCLSFHEAGCCSKGNHCNESHSELKLRHSNSFMLQNYPQLVIRKPSRRIMSFLA